LSLIYKILTRSEWETAERLGVFKGSAIDLKDGYIHFSTATQAPETARLHFRGQGDLVLLSFDEAAFGEALIWEPSRGGQLFPHLYRPLLTSALASRQSVDLDGDGVPILGDLDP